LAPKTKQKCAESSITQPRISDFLKFGTLAHCASQRSENFENPLPVKSKIADSGSNVQLWHRSHYSRYRFEMKCGIQNGSFYASIIVLYRPQIWHSSVHALSIIRTLKTDWKMC